MAKKIEPVRDPRATLTRWRGSRPYTKAAPHLALNPTTLSKIEKGSYLPGRKIARRIEAATGIPCADWGDKAS